MEGKIFFPKKLPLQQPHTIVYAPTDIIKQTPPKTGQSIIFHNLNRQLLSSSGQLQFQLDDQQKQLIAILWKPKAVAAYTLKPTTRKIQDGQGNYQLILVKKDSSFAKVNIDLTEKELLFLNFHQIIFQKDSLGKFFQQISFEPRKEIQKYLSQKTPQGPINKPNEIAYNNFPITISGTITDDSGEALIGASVLIKGTTIGTVTDIDGSYILNVPNSDYELIISYTGYATQEVQATASSSNIHVTLSEGLHLEEVVVTGLGIPTKKKSLAYSTTTIKQDALSGKVAGVEIQEAKKTKTLKFTKRGASFQ